MKGLINKYQIKKTNGNPVHPDARYFILRLDDGCSNKKHLAACKKAAAVFAKEIYDHNPQLSVDMQNAYDLDIYPEITAEQPSHISGQGLRWVKASDKKASMTSVVHIRDQHRMARLGNFYVEGNKWFLHINKTGIYNGFDVSEENLHLYEWLSETPSREAELEKCLGELMEMPWDYLSYYYSNSLTQQQKWKETIDRAKSLLNPDKTDL